MDVSIIIINYNTLALTRDCIDSIFTHTTDISFEVILVDNCSSDGSVDFFKNDNRIRFVESGQNLGFGKANNLGFTHAKGDFIFLLNSDTILLNNAIKLFLDTIKTLPARVGCLGCILEDTDGNEVQSAGRYLKKRKMLLNCFTSYLKPFMKVESKRIIDSNLMFQEVDMVVGADLFIRRSVIEAYGMFDPSFFMYHEENDMQRRYRKAGYVSAIIKGPRIIHLEGKSNSSSMRKKIMGDNGMFNYVRIWSTPVSYFLFRLLYMFLKSPIIFDPKYTISEKNNYLKTLINFK